MAETEQGRKDRIARREKGREITTHHRKSRNEGGKDEWDNISKVRRSQHEAFHLLFGAGLPETVAEILNGTWIDPEYELVVRKREEPLCRPREHGCTKGRKKTKK